MIAEILASLQVMVAYVLTVLVMAIVPIGVAVCMSEDMILAGLYENVKASKLPAWAQKPLATCTACMVSIWGLGACVVLGVLPPDIILAARTALHVMLHSNCGWPHWELDPSHWVPLALPLLRIPVLLLVAVWLQTRIDR